MSEKERSVEEEEEGREWGQGLAQWAPPGRAATEQAPGQVEGPGWPHESPLLAAWILVLRKDLMEAPTTWIGSLGCFLFKSRMGSGHF